MEKLAEQAVNCFNDGFNCAQAVFSTAAVQLGMDKEQALKTAGGFGGGMGGLQLTCGAVTGAFMTLGLKYGKAKKGEDDKKQKTYSLVKEFVAEFKKQYGALDCKTLIGCDLSTPEGSAYAKEHNLYQTKCVPCIKTAADIVEKMLARS